MSNYLRVGNWKEHYIDVSEYMDRWVGGFLVWVGFGVGEFWCGWVDELGWVGELK